MTKNKSGIYLCPIQNFSHMTISLTPSVQNTEEDFRFSVCTPRIIYKDD